MELKFDKKTLRHIAVWGIAIILIYWFLHDTERVEHVLDGITGIFSPFIVGAVLAFIINVPMRAFEKLFKGIKSPGFRRVLAILVTLLCAAIILAGVFMLLIPEVAKTIDAIEPKLMEFVAKATQTVNQLLTDYPEVQVWFTENFNFSGFDWSALVERVLSWLSNSINTLFPQAVSLIGSSISTIFNMFISVAFAIYALFQKETLARQGRRVVYAFLPEKAADYIVRVLRLANSTFSNFLSGQCVEVCILGSMFAITMAIFRMPYIPLISVLVAITAFIPVVGAWTGCVVGAFLILVANPIQALWFVVMFVLIQQVENNMIYPRVVGTSIGLSGMWVLVAVALGGELMGVVGMFLMIPLTSVVYALFRELVNNRVSKLTVDGSKLEAQPPELKSHFKEQRKKNKEKRKKQKDQTQKK